MDGSSPARLKKDVEQALTAEAHRAGVPGDDVKETALPEAPRDLKAR
jgi:hypothetical protein